MKLALVVLVAVVSPRVADACAPVPPPGAEVAIADEEAVIVWDPATKTETFIRRAQFRSTAQSFGFLVPTPSTPQLDEVDDTLFQRLTWMIQPRVITKTEGFEFDFGSILQSCMLMKAKGGMVDTAGAQVLQSVNVAGFVATTLRADTPEAISAWLAEHGFAVTTQLTEWLARYVENKWQITAFVVAKPDPQANLVTTGSVRMTFRTERPFYPYREPAPLPMTTTPAVTSAGRSLRVYLFAPERYQATLAGAPWSASVVHARRETVDHAAITQPYATVFFDESNPRVATDELYFAPGGGGDAPATVTITQPRRIAIPVDLLGLGAIIVTIVVVRRRNRRGSLTG